MGKQMWRYESFDYNLKLIRKLVKKYGVFHKELNNSYQIRLAGVLDLYPVRRRWHYLKDNTRGEWESDKELEEIFHDLIENYPETSVEPPVVVPEVDTYRLRNPDAVLVKKPWWKFWGKDEWKDA